MSTRMNSLSKPLRVMRDSFYGFLADDVLTLAAALSFYTLLSFAPLIGLAIWVASLAGASARASLLDELALVGGDAARSAADAVIESGKAHPDFGSFAGVAGLVLLVVGATTVFAQLQSSLNTIFKAEKVPSSALGGWLRRRIFSAGVLLAAFFVMIVSLVVSALLAWLLPRESTMWDMTNQLVSTAVFASLFGVLFRYLPDARVPWRQALAGGFITSVLFEIGKALIAIYVARADVGGAYGTAGTLVVLLVWAYYSAAIFLLGAEITKALMPQAGNHGL